MCHCIEADRLISLADFLETLVSPLVCGQCAGWCALQLRASIRHV